MSSGAPPFDGGPPTTQALRLVSRGLPSLVFGLAVLAYMIAVTQRSSLGVAGVDAADRFAASATALSTLGVMQLAVYAAMQVPVGMLLDRFGATRLILAGAIGMAVGTRFYLLAVTATLVIAALIWVMDRYDFFSKEAAVQLLKIRLPSDMTYRGLFDETFRRYVDRYDLVAMETVLAGTLTELVYSVELKRNAEVEAFLRELGELNQNNKVVLVTGQQEADL